MRPIGTRVVKWDVGELSLLRAQLGHDVDVEQAVAVILSDEVKRAPITGPPPLQAGGRREAGGRGGH